MKPKLIVFPRILSAYA